MPDQEPGGADALAVYHRGLPEDADSAAGSGSQGGFRWEPTAAAQWQAEHKRRARRSLEGKRNVYFRAGGVYCNIRLDESRQCMLVIGGMTEQGRKEFVAIDEGYRESEPIGWNCWRR